MRCWRHPASAPPAPTLPLQSYNHTIIQSYNRYPVACVARRVALLLFYSTSHVNARERQGKGRAVLCWPYKSIYVFNTRRPGRAAAGRPAGLVYPFRRSESGRHKTGQRRARSSRAVLPPAGTRPPPQDGPGRPRRACRSCALYQVGQHTRTLPYNHRTFPDGLPPPPVVLSLRYRCNYKYKAYPNDCMIVTIVTIV